MCILKKVGENQHLKRVDLAKELGLPVSTLNTLIYKRKIIEESHHQSGSSASKKLRVQSGKFADVEKGLLQWFNQCRSVKIPISGPLLMEKAQEISKKLNVECDASFSSGWLQKFKLRHGITGKTVSGKSGDVDCETVDDWIENQLPDLIKGYEQKDIFNADVTGLFYNLLPSKTLAIKSDTCHGGKKRIKCD
ncbi:Tigger transposable element-derived protein 6 [Araneus ventricosus]|uniref:Tigger transposable element-derived protein 6 n=1 Tax=Araneus ventricosus TaxID=182803 RepID=A0A4Y2S1Z2_ARAVE|nr:Tigger transposable element-derived protein 6 [Araneus ventricosus]